MLGVHMRRGGIDPLLSLTSTLEKGLAGQLHNPRQLYPRESVRVPILLEAGWVPGLWKMSARLRFKRNRPARSVPT